MKPTTFLAIAAMLIAAPFIPAQNPPAAAPVPHPIPSIQDTETPAQKDARMAW
jgi:alpha-L-fucosidase